MITFKQFLNEGVRIDIPYGIFIKATPTSKSIQKLQRQFYEFEAVQPLIDDLHCTLMFSKTSLKNMWMPTINKEKRFLAWSEELVHWPGSGDYIVLKLRSDALTGLHNRFRDEGLVPTFPDYNPHVSLLYQIQDVPKALQIMERLNGYLKQSGSMELEFYYDGYTLLDPEDGAD